MLDEPTAAMDVEARHEFWANMRDYTAAGRTVLFATHYLEEAEAFASRVVIISRGRIVADGTVAELKRSARRPNGALHARRRWRRPQPLERLPGVRQVERQGERVTLKTTDADATVRALVASGIAWQDLEVRGASLDDIFMALVASSAQREDKLMIGYLRLEVLRALRDPRYSVSGGGRADWLLSALLDALRAVIALARAGLRCRSG